MLILVLLFLGLMIWRTSVAKKQNNDFSSSDNINTSSMRSDNHSSSSQPKHDVENPCSTTTCRQVSSGSTTAPETSTSRFHTAVVPNFSSKCTTVDQPSSVERKSQSDADEDVKPEHQEMMRILRDNGVVYLYHFTDRRNLESIRKNGGLYSWKACYNNGITIPYAGGDGNSRVLDTRHGLQDYVRLSLCEDHPMMWRLKQAGYDLVLLKIKVDAAVLRDTLYSDMNATDNQHHHGGSLEDLTRIRFSATKRRYLRREDTDFKYHQAEVMIKSFLPAEYIVNLDNPQAA